MESSGLTINGDPTKLFEELAKAQHKFDPVPRVDSGQVGHTKFKYAGYATLMKCVRPALSHHGISIIQPLHSSDDGEWAITTTIIAGHGASIVSSLKFPHNENPQEFGRAHTYHRRYQLQAMLAIEGDDDADSPKTKENSSNTQFSEPAAPKVQANGKAAGAKSPASTAAAPSTSVTTAGSSPKAEPTASTAPKAATTPSEPAAPSDGVTAKSINVLLEEAMKQLQWNMSKMMEFYKEHVDSAGVEKPSNMNLLQKKALHAKLVEIHDVVPF